MQKAKSLSTKVLKSYGFKPTGPWLCTCVPTWHASPQGLCLPHGVSPATWLPSLGLRCPWTTHTPHQQAHSKNDLWWGEQKPFTLTPSFLRWPPLVRGPTDYRMPPSVLRRCDSNKLSKRNVFWGPQRYILTWPGFTGLLWGPAV